MKTHHSILSIVIMLFFGFCLPLSFVQATDCAAPPQTGNTTITASCTFLGTNEGAIAGNIIINTSQTLTVGSTQIIMVTNGNKFDLTATGSKVVIIDGGTLKTFGMLCLKDADSDTYPQLLDTTYQTYTATTCATGKIARNDASIHWLADCDDANGSVFANLTCYANADADAQYSSSSHSVCSGGTCAAIGESATPGTDCCDTDADAFLGQTLYFDHVRTTCGGYDYNCSGYQEEKIGDGGVSYVTCTPNSGSGSCDASFSDSGWQNPPGPTCGNTATYSMGGCCNPGGDCSGTAYPACGAGNQASYQYTETCH